MKCEDIRAAVFNAESGRQTAGEKLTQAVMTYIETHYLEKFSLKRMAGDLYVNGSYLLRVFRKQTGCTPLAYHHQIRCERAKELLRDTRDPVAEIGETVGFASPAHFTHVFKKLEGCTPTEYRTQSTGKAG